MCRRDSYYGEYSDVVSNGASFSIPQVQGLKVEIPEDPTKRTVTWQTIDWVDGYELERALSPSGAYELVKKIEDPNIGAFVSSKQEVGSIKYYSIRAYKVVEGVTQYGSYSEIVSNPGTSCLLYTSFCPSKKPAFGSRLEYCAGET